MSQPKQPNKPNKPKQPILYLAQNRALHKARAQLSLSIDDLRELAGDYNFGIKSLSKLSLDQRYQLIAELQRKGADVRNPVVTEWDRAQIPPPAAGRRSAPFDKGGGAGAAKRGISRGRLIRFPALTDKQRKLIDDLAARVQWRTHDGFARFCHKYLRATYPRNPREMTTVRLALESMIRQHTSVMQSTIAVMSNEERHLSSVSEKQDSSLRSE